MHHLIRAAPLCALLSFYPHFAEAQSFDAAVVVGQTFWNNLAVTIISQPIKLDSGQINIIDAIYCGMQFGSPQYLTALSVGSANRISYLSSGDCSKSPDVLLNAAPTGIDGILLLSVAASANGVEARASSVASKSASVPAPVQQQIAVFKQQFSSEQVQFVESGQTITVTANVRFHGPDLAFLISRVGYPQALTLSDLPSLASLSSSTNVAVVAAHATLTRSAATDFHSMQYAIKGTNYTATSPTYSGQSNAVTLGATISNGSSGFLATATWTGSPLLMSSFAAKSARNCANLHGLNLIKCQGQQAVENAAAAPIAAEVLRQNKQTPLAPFVSSKPISLTLLGRPFTIGMTTYGSAATGKALSIAGNMYAAPNN
jgi:hypothetical protein